MGAGRTVASSPVDGNPAKRWLKSSAVLKMRRFDFHGTIRNVQFGNPTPPEGGKNHVLKPPSRQPRGKTMAFLVNSHTNATRIGWHLCEIDSKEFDSGQHKGNHAGSDLVRKNLLFFHFLATNSTNKMLLDDQ